jgi:hypothetical protein
MTLPRTGMQRWQQFTKRARASTGTETRKLCNNVRIYGLLTKLIPKKEDRKAQIEVIIGNFSNDPNAEENEEGEKVRKLEVTSSKNAKDKTKDKEKYPDHIEFKEGSLFDFQIDFPEDLHTGVLLKLEGIRLVYWWSEIQDKILTLKNVDKVTCVPGYEVDGFSYSIVEKKDLFRTWFLPQSLVEPEKCFGRYGTNLYRLDHYVPDRFKILEDKSVSEGCLFEINTSSSSSYETEIFIETQQKNKKVKAFSGVAQGMQWKDGHPDEEDSNKEIFNVFFTIYPSGEKKRIGELEIFRIFNKITWEAIGPVIMTNFNYTILCRENIKNTQTNCFNIDVQNDTENIKKEGKNFELSVRVLGVLCDVVSEYKRIGIPLGKEKLLKFCQFNWKDDDPDTGIIQSPVHDKAYHEVGGFGSKKVINLSEWTGSLSDLIEGGDYDFVAITNAPFENRDFNKIRSCKKPQDLIYLLNSHFVEQIKDREDHDKGDAARVYLESEPFNFDVDDPDNKTIIDLAEKIPSKNFIYCVFAVHSGQAIEKLLEKKPFIDATTMLLENPNEFITDIKKKYDIPLITDTKNGGGGDNNNKKTSDKKKTSEQKQKSNKRKKTGNDGPSSRIRKKQRKGK